MMINPTMPCVDCGKPIDDGRWYYGMGRAGGKDGVVSCCECGGTGSVYTMEDETQIGQAPGSSQIDCPCCSKMRAALGHQQRTTQEKKP